MKYILKVWALLFAVIALQSCDKVNPPYKETINVAPPPSTLTSRKVLVEDYTGHTCGNCPAATRILYNDLKPVYGDNLIIMAIHAGGFATPYPQTAPYYTYDFRTTEGTTLDTDFGISLAGNPNGMVNRREVNGSLILPSTKWVTEVGNVLNDTTPSPVNLVITNDYNSTTRNLTTDVEMEFTSTLSGTHKLCVFMVEDSIINWQKDYQNTSVPGNNVQDYVHREVFRGSMNGAYGEAVIGTAEGDVSTLSYSFSLPAAWNDQKVSIITYLYRDDTKEIIQVEQKEIHE